VTGALSLQVEAGVQTKQQQVAGLLTSSWQLLLTWYQAAALC
jgi:hypothetical protein